MGPDSIAGGSEGGVTEVAPVVTSVETGSAAAASTPVDTGTPSAAASVPESAAPVTDSATAEPAAPAAETAKDTAEPAKPAPSLLSEAGKDASAAEGDKTAEVAAETAPEVVLPTYEAFTLPEGLEIKDQTQIKAFTDILGEFELQAKIPHELAQEMGQKFMSLYADVSQRMQAEALQAQQDVWASTRQSFVEEIKNDPVIGRNRFETSLKDAVLVRDMFATPKTLEMMDFTGAGDHIGMMQFCVNVSKFLHKHGLLREGTPVTAPAQKGANPTGKGGQRNRYSSKGA